MIHQKIVFNNEQGRFEYKPFEPRLTCKLIQEVVADHYGLHPFHMTSMERAHSVARPRQIAMFLTRKLTKMTLPQIGNRFGGRDHTTVLHGIRKIQSLRDHDEAIHEALIAIESRLPLQ